MLYYRAYVQNAVPGVLHMHVYLVQSADSFLQPEEVNSRGQRWYSELTEPFGNWTNSEVRL